MNDNGGDMRISEVPKTLRELALERMRGAILALKFKPGERLTERDLCDRLGVSRSVVREVMRHLEAESLVQTIPNHGIIVARLDAAQAAEIYEIRGLLESRAAHACAEHAGAPILADLRKALEAIEHGYKSQDDAAILGATRSFYEAMFRGAEQSISWEIVERLNGRISRLRALTINSPNRNVTGPAQLRKIFAAINGKKPEAAAEACRDHVRSAAAVAMSIIEAQRLPPAERSLAKPRKRAAAKRVSA